MLFEAGVPRVPQHRHVATVPSSVGTNSAIWARLAPEAYDALESLPFERAARHEHRRIGERVSLLDHIGRTRLVPLRHMAPEGSARILLKLEYENPTGSMKDRMALAMVEAALADGRLRPGGSVVEYTGGSTGVSLAFVCAAKRVPLEIVTSDAFSREKRDHMAALGARLTLIPSPTGGTTKALTLEMIETARRLATAPGSYWTDQLNNTDQLPSYARMADEILEQAMGKVSAFVQTVGTAGSLRGVSTRLRAHDASVRVVAVEPEESAVLSGGPSGSHKIEGTGAGFVVPLWTPTLADEIQTVSSREAMATARRLTREEGVFAGTSTGANVAVALRVAERLGPGATVVTLAVDSGMKYLSTALYSRA
jgi:cysteine synthase A